MKQEKLNYFRPKARHIFTIGRDLIKDDFSALIELVKNAYDADATKIDINFKKIDKNGLKITIQDDGHGMTEDDIRNKWLVPSTNNKLKARKSPKGRIMQGQKGIGRYAASVLGEKMILESVDEKGNKTILNINWEDFNKSDKFLDEIILDIKIEKTNESSGIKLVILGGEKELKIWENEEKKEKLKIELQKLKPPFSILDNFIINLNYFGDSIDLDDNKLSDFYDYKIEGEIDENGNSKIKYINADTKKEEFLNKKIENKIKIKFLSGIFPFPGKIKFEFLVVDLEVGKDGIKRQNISKQSGRNIDRKIYVDYFKKYAGVYIYRGDFRIRPYGDPGKDWLNLAARRVDSPTKKLGSNQVLGYIQIDSEEKSHLIEASSREGLKENEYFSGLINELYKVLEELENKRFDYRGEVGLREKNKKEVDLEEEIKNIEKEILEIKSDEDKQKVIEKTKKLGENIKKEEERLNNIIIQYEGQATLGKMLNITFHEITKPITSMKGNIVFLDDYIKEIEKQLLAGLGEWGEKLKKLIEQYKLNSTTVHDFLKRLKPLSAGRGRKKSFLIKKVLEKSFDVFKLILEEKSIKVNLEKFEDFEFYGYEKDFIVVFTNFIDNSIYWLEKSNIENKEIKIEIIDNKLYFKDNGLGLIGFETEEEKKKIFEPGFSRKNEGSGLGLAIAGDILERENIKLNILKGDGYYNFILELIFKKGYQ